MIQSGRGMGVYALEGIYSIKELVKDNPGEIYGYLNPPVDPFELRKLLRKNALHESALAFKSTLIATALQPHQVSDFYSPFPTESKGLLNRMSRKKALQKHFKKLQEFKRFLTDAEFYRFVHDSFTFGNSYLLKMKNRGGKLTRLHCLPALRTRILTKEQGYCLIKDSRIVEQYTKDQVIHHFIPCPESDYYGLSDYLGAVNPILLSYAIINQRISYHDNNGHVKSITLLNINPGDVDEEGNSEKEAGWAEQAGKAREPGQPNNLFINLRGASEIEDVKKVATNIDLSQDIGAEDSKTLLKEGRMAIHEAHQVPPELIGAVLDSKTSVNLSKLLLNWWQNVLEPQATRILNTVNADLDLSQWIDVAPRFVTEEQLPDQTKDEKDTSAE